MVTTKAIAYKWYFAVYEVFSPKTILGLKTIFEKAFGIYLIIHFEKLKFRKVMLFSNG